MTDFEKLGLFYLGRGYDLAQARFRDELLLYDANDLTTHAVCVGMTGSGKTGLCLSLLEEAAIDGIPAIAIDPKGDLGNLLLTFPELRPADFRPWVDPHVATREGISPDQLAEKTAERWRQGLAEWGQEPARISRFADAVERTIYTPGSSAGMPLAVLRSLSAPPPALRDDTDAMRERITAAVSGLLGLLGIEADPLQSREHILLSNILDRAWRAGEDVSLESLVQTVSKPGIERIGVVDLESFFPSKERFALAMQLNALLASPGAAAWAQGEPLDVQRLLYTPAGKPRLSIISIAHLKDEERMFFVTLLLSEVLAWMRSQPGTSSLRALLYMDEVLGYLPPTANPPSKPPMLTLLKQARAFGLGVVLATQNPVDLDYKALSNAGTWFLGRLQTERDKARVLEGLEGASASAAGSFDRGAMEQVLAGLGNRVFLMHNVHEDRPTVFQTRWALSYLRGPLATEDIRRLMAQRRAAAASSTATTTATTTTAPAVAAGAGSSAPATASSAVNAVNTVTCAAAGATARPVLPPEIVERFLPRRRELPSGARCEYYPCLVATGRLHYVQTKPRLDTWEDVVVQAPAHEDPAATWSEATISTAGLPSWSDGPEAGAGFAPLPAALSKGKTYDTLARGLKQHLYQARALELWSCPAVKLVSNPGESEGDFRVRAGIALREARDAEMADLRAKYGPKRAALEERLRKAEQRVEKEKSQARHEYVQSMISIGTSVLGAVLGGRKGLSATKMRQAGTAMRSASRAARQRGDVGQAEETAEAVGEQIAAWDAELEAELQRVQSSFEPMSAVIEQVSITPRKTDLVVQQVVLAWRPMAVRAGGTPEGLD